MLQGPSIVPVACRTCCAARAHRNAEAHAQQAACLRSPCSAVADPLPTLPCCTLNALCDTGFGGSKRAQKQNDAYSAADMDGYKGSSKGGFGNKGGKGGGKVSVSRRRGCSRLLQSLHIIFGAGRWQCVEGLSGSCFSV